MMVQYLIVGCLCALIVLAVIILVVLLSRSRAIGGPSGPEHLIEQQIGQIERIQQDVDRLGKLFIVPQTRGTVGETLLKGLLDNWLPGHAFSTQHSFQSGARVDAVIKLGDYLVAVDAKFPLESVRPLLEQGELTTPISGEIRRSILNHIDAISSKYIRPQEGTLHFALMYIPSERVYYHLFVEEEGETDREELLNIALRKGVVPVSPSNLFLYLQTVAYGFQGFAAPEKQRELIQTMYQLKTDFTQFAKSFSVAGNHLKNLYKSFDECREKVNRLSLTVEKLQRRE